MPEDFDQNTNRERHAAWERAHEIGSPTHRLRTALILKTVATLEKRRRAETTDALDAMSSRGLRSTEFVYSGPGSCLDAGCGTGEFALAMAARGWQVIGFDPSEYAIGIARKAAEALGRAVEFVVSGAQEFPTGETFNLVLSIDVLEHIEGDAAAMFKLASLVSPSGALVVSVPMDPALWSSADEFSGHFRRYTRESLATLAEGAGLRIEKMTSYGYPFTRLMWRAKKRMPAAESRVVEAGESARSADRFAARAASKIAVAVTSLDRLFGGDRDGVGLVAVCRKGK
jgi:2-polyprenyl-3-methyl-5-hydroxy-6-metoxy-1,4-benzoquinol methylase